MDIGSDFRSSPSSDTTFLRKACFNACPESALGIHIELAAPLSGGGFRRALEPPDLTGKARRVIPASSNLSKETARHEKNVSAQQDQQKAYSRLPRPHEHPQRSCRHQPPSCQGPQDSVRLIKRCASRIPSLAEAPGRPCKCFGRGVSPRPHFAFNICQAQHGFLRVTDLAQRTTHHPQGGIHRLLSWWTASVHKILRRIRP